MAQAADLILVDGSSFLYRAYYAAKKGFSTKSGFPTGATFIITRMLRNLVSDYANHKILVTFDAHGDTFRHEIYPEYKATRPPMPEDLAVQIPAIHHIVVAMGFPVISLPGVEADDVMGSYAKEASAQGLKVLICTGDKDMAQLVNDNVLLKDTMKDITYTRDEVINKYGVPPELIIDLLALKGDISDNIPGMKGVGDVTANLLLNQVGGVYAIKDNLDKVKTLDFRGSKTFATRFREQWPTIEMSYKLATIKCDLPLPFSIDEIQVPQENNDVLIALFERLEFYRFASEQRAKKAAFSDLLTNLHGKDAQGVKLKSPQIVGFQLEQLEFTVPKGTVVEDVEDPNKVKSSAKTDITTALSVESTSVTDSQQTATSSVSAQSKEDQSKEAQTESASKTTAPAPEGAQQTSGLSQWLNPKGKANQELLQDNATIVTNTDSQSEPSDGNDEEEQTFIVGMGSGRPNVGQAILDPSKATSLLEQIEGVVDPDLFKKKDSGSKSSRGRKKAKTDSTTAATEDVATTPNTVTTTTQPVSAPTSDQSLDAKSESDMASLMAVLKDSKPHDNISLFEQSFKLVVTDSQLQELIDKLEKSERFTFFTTTEDTQPSMSKLIGLSICLGESESFYIPFEHSYLGVPAQLNKDKTLKALSPAFNSDKIIKVAHDIKQHRLVLSFAGLEMSGPMLDVMVLCHLLNSTQTIDLNNLAERYNHYTSLFYDKSFEYKDPIVSLDLKVALKKECEKSLMTYRLIEPALKELQEIYPKKKGDELLKFEMEVLEVLYAMERKGALVDSLALDKLTLQFRQKLIQIEDQIYDEVGESFKLTSPRILGKMLFEKMGIPYPRSTSKVDIKGHRTYSTNEEILSELTDYPIANLILEYRSLSKLITTYTKKLPSLISARTGRVHTNFNLAGTNTGRLSSSEPNLQNIPIRGSDGKMIRDTFVAPAGYSIVSADYSQIEMRIIAHLSQDKNLKQAFINHQDIHLVAASEVLGKPIGEVTPTERSHAKATNYGIIYGMSFQGLAKQTGMNNADAKEFITNYFKKYPAIKDYLENVKRYATRYGYVTSLDGRKIFIKDIKSSGMVYRQAARAAINAPMQGSAADIIKHAMVNAYKYIQTLEPGSVSLTLQVHDELVFEVKDSILPEFCAKIQEIMANAYVIDVPIEVSVGHAHTWGDAH